MCKNSTRVKTLFPLTGGLPRPRGRAAALLPGPSWFGIGWSWFPLLVIAHLFLAGQVLWLGTGQVFFLIHLGIEIGFSDWVEDN